MSSNKHIPLKVAFFSIMILFMFFSPFYKQVLGGKSELVRKWSMYQFRGVQMCAVQYHKKDADGTFIKIDRYKRVGEGSWRTAKNRFKRVYTRNQALSVGVALCDSYGGDIDIRVNFKCKGKNYWETVFDRDFNVCKIKRKS